MNSWTFLIILSSLGIILITEGNKKDNRFIATQSTSSSYPDIFLQQTVEKCNNYKKYPWFLAKANDEKMCKNLLFTNEYLFSDSDDEIDDSSAYNNRKNYYRTDDHDYDDTLSDLMNTQSSGQQNQDMLTGILMNDKRGLSGSGMGCDCQIRNDVIDLGYPHFPRYLFNAVCQTNKNNNDDGIDSGLGFGNKRSQLRKCWRGSHCKPVEYKVRVLTRRTNADMNSINDHTSSLLPDVLRSEWKFKTVNVTAGCFCSF